MKKKINIILSLLILFIFPTACMKPRQAAIVRTVPVDYTLISVDNGRMTFHIRHEYSDMSYGELYRVIHNANPNVLFIALLKSDNNTMISASKYQGTSKTSIEKAFDITVKYVGDENYKLLDFGTYSANNKTFRYKVSTTGTGAINLMYYFMKNDYDYDLYEIKAVIMPVSYDKTRKILEKIAATVEIK